jgi:ankyrin repeat protein
MIELLCQNGRVDRMARDKHGCTILHRIVDHHPEMFSLVFRYSGIDINDVDAHGRTPLFYAARSEEATAKGLVAKLLNSCGALNNVQDKDGRTPLSHAVEVNNYKAIDLLLSGIGVDDVDAHGKTPLFYAAGNSLATTTVDKLINSYGASSDVQNGDGGTPLSHAAEHNNYEAIDLLLKAGADCTLEDGSGKSPMSYAVGFGHVETTERLVQHLKDGNDALKLAWQMGKDNIETALLEMRQDHTNFEEDNLRRLLLRAARDGQGDIVWEILHFHKIEADIRDEDGRTPLSHAAEFGHRRVIEFLVERKADRDLEDDRDQSPLDYAKKCDEKTFEHLSEDWSSRSREPEQRSSALRWPWRR